jgi:hypothetical protein
MTRHSRSSTADRLYGQFGLFLLVLVALAADRGYHADGGVRAGITAVLCRGLIEAVGVVGRIVDRLPSRQHALTVAPAH